MVQPIDYTRGFGSANPFGSVMQGLEAGAAFAGIEQQQAARAMQMQQMQQAQERQRAAGEAFNALMDNPNATHKDYLRVSMLLPEAQSKALMSGFDAQNQAQRAVTLSRSAQVMAAFRNNAPDVGFRLLEEWRDGETNSGRADQGRAIDTVIQLGRQDPRIVPSMVGASIAGLPGAKELIDNLNRIALSEPELRSAVAAADKAEADARGAGVAAEFARPLAVANLSSAQSDAVTKNAAAAVAPELARLGVQQARANISNLQSQIGDRARRLQLDTERLALDTAKVLGEISDRNGRIPESAQKEVNGAAIAAGTATQQATRLNALATELSGLDARSGAAGSAIEYLKRVTGNQDAVTLLRQEYVRMRQSLVSGALPPGAASDKDIALAMEGFLPSNASPQAMASFLRGMAKIQGITAEVETARGDWLTNNRGSLGRAAQPFQAGRFRTIPGETFAGFTDRVTKELARPPEGSAQRAIEQIPDSGAPRTPAAPRPAQGAAMPPLPAGFAVDRR